MSVRGSKVSRSSAKKTGQNVLKLSTLIQPCFVVGGKGIQDPIQSMPGISRFSVDRLIREVRSSYDLGITKFLLFGAPQAKSWKGTSAYDDDNIVAQALKVLKIKFPDITLMTDICLCAYTTHGHCGIVPKGKEKIHRASTLKALSDMALTHAKAGADYVAPSAMIDGQVKAIRQKLDQHGFQQTRIMGYSAKFASNFYGPFRDIADSAPAFGDRTGYQLDYCKADVALRKVKEDIQSGADIVMVKPALGYLDIVRQVKDFSCKPVAVYNVSGEYALVKNGVKSGLWKEKNIVYEILSSFKRAGADLIITYHAKDIAKWQK